MTKKKAALLCAALWLAVVAWMGTLFILSAQTGPESADLSGDVIVAVMSVMQPGFSQMTPAQQLAAAEPYQHLARKCAHFTAYFVLGLLSWLALGRHRLSVWSRVILALAIAFAYAASDEIHQLWVVGRGAMATDVLIDASGALLAVALAAGVGYMRKKCAR